MGWSFNWQKRWNLNRKNRTAQLISSVLTYENIEYRFGFNTCHFLIETNWMNQLLFSSEILMCVVCHLSGSLCLILIVHVCLVCTEPSNPTFFSRSLYNLKNPLFPMGDPMASLFVFTEIHSNSVNQMHLRLSVSSLLSRFQAPLFSLALLAMSVSLFGVSGKFQQCSWKWREYWKNAAIS